MRRFFTKKRALVALGAIAAMVVASAAFAAFTSSGSGAGTASVGSDAGGSWAVSQTAPTGALYPDPAGTGSLVGNGANVETLAYSVTNKAKGSLLLASVTATIANSDGSAWSSQDAAKDPACTAQDFSINGKPVGQPATETVSTDVNAGASTTGSFTIEMIDNGSNQNSCQGVQPPIYYTAN